MDMRRGIYNAVDAGVTFGQMLSSSVDSIQVFNLKLKLHGIDHVTTLDVDIQLLPFLQLALSKPTAETMHL